MRPLCVALLFAAPVLAENDRVPLCVLGTHSLRTGDDRAWPMATIGSVPEGSQPVPPFQGLLSRLEGSRDGRARQDPACEALVKGLSEGTTRLGPPRPGGHALVFLVGPMLDSGEHWEPVALSRHLNQFGLEIVGWQDNGPRRRNVPSRPTVLLSLGELPAGDYALGITYRGMFLDVESGAAHYTRQLLQSGSLPFHIMATPEVEGEAVTLPQGALKVHPIEPTKADQRRPYAGAYRVPTRMGERSAPCVRAGTFDLAAWAASQDGGPTTLPKLDPPGEGDPVYACVTGPMLNSMEWLSLAKVTWTEEGVRLLVEVWRDEGDRDKNIPFTPVLVVPLDGPAKAGVRRVDVEWKTLRADAPGGLYRAESDPLLQPVHADFELR